MIIVFLILKNILSTSTIIHYFNPFNTSNLLQIFLAYFTILSQMPIVNNILILSLLWSGLIPIAYYLFIKSFFKNNPNLSIISTFLYITFSGYGWISVIL